VKRSHAQFYDSTMSAKVKDLSVTVTRGTDVYCSFKCSGLRAKVHTKDVQWIEEHAKQRCMFEFRGHLIIATKPVDDSQGTYLSLCRINRVAVSMSCCALFASRPFCPRLVVAADTETVSKRIDTSSRYTMCVSLRCIVQCTLLLSDCIQLCALLHC